MVGTAALAMVLSLVTQTWPSVAGPLPRAGGGENDVAVIVAASDYVFLPDIDGATTNGDDWYAWLARVRGVPLDRITLLKDREATREKIERAVTAAASSSKAAGLVWFVFIGHGAPGPGGDDGVLLGVDTQADIDSLSARGIAQSFVTRTIGSGRQRQAVVVFDACFSGKSPDGDDPLVPGMQATVPVRRISAAAKHTTVLAASETFAGPLPGAARPAFSYALLGALRGWGDDNGDARITIDEAYRSARRTLQIAYKSDARLPKMSGDGSAVVATSVSESAPDLTAIAMGRSSVTSVPSTPVTSSWPVPTTIAELSAAIDKAISGRAPPDHLLELHARLGELALQEARRRSKANDSSGGAANYKRAERNFQRAVELWTTSSKRGVVEELTAMSEYRLAEIELMALLQKAPRSTDAETLKAELRNADLMVRPILARFDRVVSGYASTAWAVQGLFAKGAVSEILVRLYGDAPCPSVMNPAQCQQFRAVLKTQTDKLTVEALGHYEAAVKMSETLGQNSEEARMARMSVTRLKAR